MSEVRPQLLITVVHGTWPRGLIPTIVRIKHWVRELMRWKRPGPLRFWFEESSPFLDRLSAELDDIPHKIRRLLWSGANSIFVRDKTAHILADHLSTEHAAHPEATQLVIAHSHGGNIALRALYRLQKREACWSDSTDTANPLVVTLATPFIEIHQADFGRRPLLVRVALTVFVMLPIFSLLVGLAAQILNATFFPSLFDPSDKDQLIVVAAMINLAAAVMGLWWIVRRAPARRNKLDALKNATRLGELVSAQRLLIIRAVDDEAALTLALGAILNYVTARSITFVLLLWFVGPAIGSFFSEDVSWFLAIVEVSFLLAFTFFGILMLSRSVHGQELAVSPLECQINTQSTPDAMGLSKIITLVRRTYVKSRRHGIYDHKDCPKAISDWVRSQLYALPAR